MSATAPASATDELRHALRAVQARLAASPEDGHTLDDAAVLLYRAGQFRTAADFARRAAAALPRDPLAHDHLGLILLAAGEPAAAVVAARRAVALAPRAAPSHLNLGNALLAAGSLPEALRALARATELAPAEPLAWFNLANAFARAGDRPAAIEHHRRALALAPSLHAARRNLAILLRERGAFREAAAALAADLGAEPELWHLQALTFIDLAAHASALAPLQRTLALEPARLAAHLDLARCLRHLERHEEARAAAESAARLAPADPAVWNVVGTCTAPLAAAEHAFRHALALRPDFPDPAINLARRLVDAGTPAEALPVLDAALALNPAHAELLYTRGVALFALNRGGEAGAAFTRAAELRPEHVSTQWNKALCELRTGDFARGWADYEWRWRNDSREPRRFTHLPEWPAECPADGHLLVWGEQGVGDEVMFASLLPAAHARVSRLTLTCTPRLVPLFRRSFPELAVVAHDPDRKSPDPPIAADWQIPLGSLPPRLWTPAGPPHAGRPFLVPAPERVATLRARYHSDNRPVVGFAWRSTNAKLGALRSLPPELWTAALRGLPFRLVSLQYGDCSRDLALAAAAGLDLFHDREIDPMRDLDGFAAQLAALDAVLTIDNSTVHFAGALGVPTWMLTPTPADWRWLEHGESTHWYRGVHLLRQPLQAGWAPVLAEALAALTTALSRPATTT
ncbi:MAG: tetratricopeptide repeat protein [Opitutaceae bacterium]